MKLDWVRIAACLTCVAVYQGCGGSKSDGDGGGTNLASGLPPEKSLGDLTEAEARQLCEAEARALESVSNSARCTFFGAVEAISIGESGEVTIDTPACEAARDECLANDPTDEITCDQPQSFGECDISVREYEACTNATFRRANMLFSALTCTTVPTAEQIETFDPNEMAPECTGLSERCPAAFGGPSTSPPSATGCDDTCEDANDGICDDGGPGSEFDFCGLGTDCTDCGPR